MDAPNFSIECSLCGSPTNEGRLCAKCRDVMAVTLARTTAEMKLKNESVSKPGTGFYSKK